MSSERDPQSLVSSDVVITSFQTSFMGKAIKVRAACARRLKILVDQDF